MNLKRRNDHVVWLNRYKFSWQTKFLQVFLINKKWRRLTHFSIINLFWIYNYLLKNWLTVGIFYICSFSKVWCFFSLHLMEIFPNDTWLFEKKSIFKPWFLALAYEKQGRAIVACLIAKFRGYRRVKSHMPPAK